MKNFSRRSFIEKGSFYSLVGFVSFFAFLGSKPKNKKKMFVHHVYFWMKNPNSAEDKKKLLEGLRSLATIETVKTVHIGVPAKTDRGVIDDSYQYSLLLIFNNQADEQIYQVHPTHKKFIENYASLWEKVIVYDSEDV
jgi:hypothetical protein